MAHTEDDIALLRNDIRKLFIRRGIDPMGATAFGRGITKAIDTFTRGVQDNDIVIETLYSGPNPRRDDESAAEGEALLRNDIRKLFISKGIDPMGATRFESGIYLAIDYLMQGMKDGDIVPYGESDARVGKIIKAGKPKKRRPKMGKG